MNGKLVGIAIGASALFAGAAIYYLQVYAFYEEIEAPQVRLTSLVTGQPEPFLAEDVEAVDAGSSPLRYRACFTTRNSTAMLSESFMLYEGAEPLIGPGWLSCFDAEQAGAALEAGSALAFLGEANVTYGIDRVVAVFDDGRGMVWNQMNHCGEAVFDGKPAPEGCPPPPPAGQ